MSFVKGTKRVLPLHWLCNPKSQNLFKKQRNTVAFSCSWSGAYKIIVYLCIGSITRTEGQNRSKSENTLFCSTGYTTA